METAILAFLTFLVVGAFSSRAVFADEHIFLKLAQSALENPLFPADTPVIYFGTRLPNYIGHTHPPATEYYLALLYVLWGGFEEVPFRLLFAIFPVLAVLSFYLLARRFTSEPFFVALLFLACPAFFVVSPTLMMDIPVVAFLLTGLVFYFRGWLVPAALCFTLALGSGYAAMVPLACLTLILFLSGRPWKEFAAVLAAPLLLILWLLAMTSHFGEFPLTQTFRYLAFQDFSSKPLWSLFKLRLGSIGINTIATLSFAGGVLVFPGTVRLRSRRSWVGAAALAIVLSGVAPGSLAPGLFYRVWLFVLVLFGIMILAACAGAAEQIIRSGIRNGGEPVLILWVPAVLIFFVVVGEMMTARYLLLTIPAIFLLVFRESTRADLMATIIPTAVLSLALSYADKTFVDSYRTWVDENITELQQQGFRIWGAAESGLRFELEEAGAETLFTGDHRPSGTDLVVRQEMFAPSLGEDLEVVLTELHSFPLGNSFPVRTFSHTSHAGFWGSKFGLVPYVWSSEPFDVIHVLQVNPLVSGLPQDSANSVVYSQSGPLFTQTSKEEFFSMKIPARTSLFYDVERGVGHAELTSDGIRLINESPAPLEWHRLRLTPSQWIDR